MTIPILNHLTIIMKSVGINRIILVTADTYYKNIQYRYNKFAIILLR